jgi:hypothetical protein
MRRYLQAMITSQRVIIYRTEIEHDEFDYELVTEYEFGSISQVDIIGESFSRFDM